MHFHPCLALVVLGMPELIRSQPKTYQANLNKQNLFIFGVSRDSRLDLPTLYVATNA